MKTLFLSAIMSVAFVGLNANASEIHNELFYWGTQKTLTGEAQCVVKIEDRTDAELAASAVAYLLHDQSYVNIGEETLTYVAKNNAYIFNSQDAGALVKQVVLFLDQTSEPTRYAASVLHGSHYDPVFCENLKLAQGSEIQDAEDFISQYASADSHADEDHDHDEEVVVGGGHDHEEEHSHDHDHDHAH